MVHAMSRIHVLEHLSSSGTLIHSGKIGSGKSVLLANMVDDLAPFALKGTLAYFFCRHDIAESLISRTILGSLARQLLQNFPPLGTLDDTHHKLDDIDDIVDFLRHMLP